MSKLIRFVLAVIAGIAVGSVVNMALIMLSGHVIPPPAGADVTTMEGLRASLHLFEPRHFVFPFLAHALGTITGAVVATLLTPGRRAGPALVVGLLFLAGGITNVTLLPAPLWFNVLDLVAAYVPAAWLGHRIVTRAPAARAAGS
jgi:hypothetical protein